MNSPATDDDAGEFAALRTLDVLAAFLHQKYGEEALRQCFSVADNDRESLEDAAGILADKGLDRVAEIMLDIAAQCRSEIESNPYDPDDGTRNWSEWRRSWLLHRRLKTGELERDLRRRMSGNRQKHCNSRH